MPELESPVAAAPSQADVLAENETLRARLRQFEGAAGGQSPELVAALSRATVAEARVAALEKQLVEVEASVERRAGSMSAAIVAAAGITGSKEKPAAVANDRTMTATERALEARRAAGLKDPTTV